MTRLRIDFNPPANLDLTRSERRQFRKNAVRIDRISDADRKFFERFPHRKFRLRIAGQAEIAQKELIHGRLQNCGPGEAPFILIKNIAPGDRMKLYVVLPKDFETDLPNDLVEALWEQATALAPDEIGKIEMAMRELVQKEQGS